MANFGEGGGNAFVNDGSFMEMFKRLQEQQKDNTKTTSTEDCSKSGSSASEGEREADKTPGPMSDINKEKVSEEKKAMEKTTTNIDPPLVKASQGVMLGKRKSLMKSIELREKRKRRRVELEQEQQLAQEQDDKDKSSAWKAYMAQVKAYEARNCTDSEGHRRPLVK